MRLVLRNVAVLVAAYALLITGFLAWLAWSGFESEKLIIQEALTLLARERAAELDAWIQDARDRTDLLADDRLRRQLMDVLETSEIVTSITVVDADGRVMASDGTRSGTQLPPALAVFKSAGRPEAFARPIPGLMNRDHHVLFLPTRDGDRLAGYIRITFRSTQIMGFTQMLRQRFGREIVIGLAIVTITAIFFHFQLVRHVRRASRYIEAKTRDAAAPVPPDNDEFSSIYRAADRMGQALETARLEQATSARRFGEISDVIRVGLLWFRADKSLDFVNRRACALVGAIDTQEFRLRWSDIAQTGNAVMDMLESAETARSEPIDATLGDPPRLLRLQFYRIGADECEGFIGLITDPEMIESLEEDLYLAGQLKSLGRVVRTIAHEVRKPLGAMIVNMDLLRESLAHADPENTVVRSKQERYLGVVQNELERLNQTLIEMLDEIVPLVQKPERVDIGSILHDLGTLLSEQARRQRVEVQLELADASTVLGRKDHLKQVFLNVAVNALEAMPRGGRLMIRAEHRNGIRQVQFCDTGPGISPDLLDRIFEMGFSTKESGTGTGLYLARLILDQHGGSIGVENSTNGGARFTIEIPAIGAEVGRAHAARADR